jgi:stage IV sporulation protein FB
MGYQDRRYNSGNGDYGEGGGFRRAMRRIFVEGDNFYGWSFPLFTVPRWVPGLRGIEVRIHLLFVVFVIAQLIWPLTRDSVGFAFAAFSMFTLWTLVLLHEFGHCLACRLVGGEADRVLLWPLGGLAMCRPPHRWKASLITTLGGPGVNFVLIPVFGGLILLLGGGWGAIVFNPFNPTAVWINEPWFVYDTAYWRYFLWSAYYVNLLLFSFNMLLVMYPMDAGRIVQELLWWRIGYRKSMLIATNLGLVMAFVVGAFALMSRPTQSTLFAIAVFGGITCFNQRRMLAVMEDEPGWAYDTDKGHGGFGDDPATAAQQKAYKAALKRQQKEAETQREVDRILDKIRDKGMQSLSGRERAILKDATERGKGRS